MSDLSTKAVFKRGEILPLEMLVKLDGVVQDLSDVTLAFGVKKSKGDEVYAIQKMDSDFNKAQADQGWISVLVEWELVPGKYIGELQVDYPDSTRDKSMDIPIEILAAVNMPLEPLVANVSDRGRISEVVIVS